MPGWRTLDPLLLAVALVGGALLLGLWVGSLRRDLRRRRGRAADWDAAGEAVPALWTSAARCPDCGARGGLLEEAAGERWFACLACGGRHRREQRG